VVTVVTVVAVVTAASVFLEGAVKDGEYARVYVEERDRYWRCQLLGQHVP